MPPMGASNNDWGISAINMTKKKRENLGVALEVRGEVGVGYIVVAFSRLRGSVSGRLQVGGGAKVRN